MPFGNYIPGASVFYNFQTVSGAMTVDGKVPVEFLSHAMCSTASTNNAALTSPFLSWPEFSLLLLEHQTAKVHLLWLADKLMSFGVCMHFKHKNTLNH